jgi:hypothetical protein
MPSFPRLLLPAACALAALAPAASATQVLLNPTQDAFVSSANPSSNYGKAGALLVDAAGLPKGEFDSLLEFNLASAKSTFDSTFGVGNWVIQSIQLQLISTTPNNSIFNSPNTAGSFTVTSMQNTGWAEGTGTPSAPTTTGITFSTLPSFRGGSDELLGTYSFPGGTTGSNTYSLGLTPNFFSAATGGGLVSLLALPADSGIIYTANSEDNMTPSNHPVLIVTAQVPEPASGSLVIISGLAILCSRLPRRHSVFCATTPNMRG